MGSFIPVNTTYYSMAIGKVLQGDGINRFPDHCSHGDMYNTLDYTYYYEELFGQGWTVYQVKDTKKTVYSPLQSEINGQKVVCVDKTYAGCENIKIAPEIPEGVISLTNTFNGCISLTKAPTIPNTVTNIVGAFRHCKSLETPPAIPDSVQYMKCTFDGCTNLRTAPILPKNVCEITAAFRDCISLTTAPVIPNGVIVADGAFVGCMALTVPPELPESVDNANYIFLNCTAMAGPFVCHAELRSFSGALHNTKITEVKGNCSQKMQGWLMQTIK